MYSVNLKRLNKDNLPLKTFQFTYLKSDQAQRHQYWTFDPPEADKCLLAFGEFDV